MAGWQDGDWRNEDLCKYEEFQLAERDEPAESMRFVMPTPKAAA
jgi:hypothetical protein